MKTPKTIDSELEAQNDNGRNLTPFGICFCLFAAPIVCVWHEAELARERVKRWNWATILTWFSILTFTAVGIGLFLLVTR